MRALIVLLLIVVSALSGLVDAALVAAQAGRALIGKNLRRRHRPDRLLVPLVDAGVTGLLVAFTGGALLAGLVAWRAVLRSYSATSAGAARRRRWRVRSCASRRRTTSAASSGSCRSRRCR